MSQETLKMSRKERKKLDAMLRHQRGELLLKEAAYEMGVSPRQAVRIKKRFLERGAEGLVHAGRDVPSNRGYPREVREKALALYREKYTSPDPTCPPCGPKLASQKMRELDGLSVSRETLRRWLIDAALWRVGAKERKHRSKRPPRQRFGQLLQIDGSVHHWFGQDVPRATLLVLVDDATGRLALHMAREETTEAALMVLRKWVEKYGVPEAIYADRRTVYFTEAYVLDPARRDDPETFTQFMRATDRLGIRMIPAHSPQAKGRVERANGTLQKRLIWEFLLQGIKTIDAANAMLDDFAAAYNQEFGREPARPISAHRAPPRGRQEWEYCFCFEESRAVQRDNTVVYRGEQWQFLKQEGAPRPGARVTLRIPLGDAPPYWLYGDRRLRAKFLGPVRPRAA